MKRFFTLLMTILLCFGLFPLQALADGESGLLYNGDFEDGLIGWTESVEKQERAVEFALEPIGDAAGGVGQCLRVTQLTQNNASMRQTVQVRGNAVYRVSGFVWLTSLTQAPDNTSYGASISVTDRDYLFPQVTTNDGSWQYIEYYVRTGLTQREMTVAVGLGGKEAYCQGEAYFDDILVEEAAAPEGATVIPLYDNRIYMARDMAKLFDDPNLVTSLCFLLGVLFLALFLWAVWRYMGSKELLRPDKKMYVGAFAVLMLAGLIFRMVLAANIDGYPYDIGCFYGWASRLNEVSFGDFYSPTYFCDYPPGYFYPLWLIGFLHKTFGIEMYSGHSLILLKLPAILMDLAAGYMIMRLARRHLNDRAALTLTAVYLFNPAIWINSSVYGQMDAFLAVLIASTLLFIVRKQYHWSILCYMVAVLVKPQALVFAPVVGLGYIGGLVKAAERKTALKRIGVGLLLAAGAFILLAVPFLYKQDWTFIFEKYLTTLASYPYASLNALNLYALLGFNFVDINSQLLGLTCGTWGYIFTGLAIVGTIVGWVRWRDKKGAYFMLAALLLTTLYILGPKMHERYLMPVFLLLTLAYIQIRDRRLLYIIGGFAATNFINTALTMIWIHVPNYNIFYMLLCAVQIGLWAYLLYTAVRIFERRKVLTLSEDPVPEDIAVEKNTAKAMQVKPAYERLFYGRERAKVLWSKKEVLLLLALTLVYACFAFFHLGSTETPKTWWETTNDYEATTVDLGEVHDLSYVMYYMGINEGNIAISYSLDGVNWTEGPRIEYTHGEMYRWYPLSCPMEARYIRLRPQTTGLRVLEIGFLDTDQQAVPVQSVTGDDGSEHGFAKAFDEQEMVKNWPDPLYGMYFDELYHGRTAYEHIMGWHPYETTHPPLGKVIMMAGIEMFGMDPFGWRFMGTVFGIAMVPLMYLMTRAIFKKPKWAFVGAFLMAFDLMHFVQTRIATIDSYSVFFIMMMYGFMYLYYERSFHRQPLRQTLWPLMLCGISFGLGAATKWICLYAGAGLAILFFYTLGLRYKEYRLAKRALKQENYTPAEKKIYADVKKTFPKATVITLLVCLLFFIVIPVGIYILSYIPEADGFQKPLLETVWQNQQYMFSYHSQLIDQHPYASPWWEWALMIRPTFFYSDQLLPEGWTAGISCMGNPLIWWTGLAAIGYVLAVVLIQRRSHAATYRMTWQAMTASRRTLSDGRAALYGIGAAVWGSVQWIAERWRKNPQLTFILIGLASQFLPWVLVPRSTFLYHYFASVPFMMLCLVFCLQKIDATGKKGRWAVRIFLIAVFVLFCFFLPAVTGIPIPEGYARLLKWLPTWVLFI